MKFTRLFNMIRRPVIVIDVGGTLMGQCVTWFSLWFRGKVITVVIHVCSVVIDLQVILIQGLYMG